jgi:hypothetical protein
MLRVWNLESGGACLPALWRGSLERFSIWRTREAVRMNSGPSTKNWEDLDDLYKNSNREPAADYPYLLSAACDFDKR